MFKLKLSTIYSTPSLGSEVRHLLRHIANLFMVLMSVTIDLRLTAIEGPEQIQPSPGIFVAWERQDRYNSRSLPFLY
ncbi:hypothetical protein J6590_032735 [Homalodisca vitripennis]|nr:hypothetical protein J6590_032735 [Homalodisca vitripennis]